MADGRALAWTVVGLLGYGLLLSGVLYDVIIAPPSSGLFVDGAGKQRSLPMRMGKQNLNRQYIIEGLSAGFFVVVGSIGCILLTTANSDGSTPPGGKLHNSRSLHIISGFILFALGFNAVSLLMHRKLPNYMLQTL